MAKCAYCGEEFLQRRSDAKYCSSKHRVYAARQRARTAKKHEQLAKRFDDKAIIEQLRGIAPATAAKAAALMDEYQVDCAGAILKLCATFHAEMVHKALI